MDDKLLEDNERTENFRRLYQKSGKKKKSKMRKNVFARKGGFFRTKRREQLLGLRGNSGGRVGENTKADFWYDVREQVKTALLDLLLFIRTTDDENQHQVINKENIEPIISAIFLSYSIRDFPEPNPERAKMALMLIQKSFEYLQKTTTTFMTSSQERMIDDAKNIAKQLTVLLVPENDRPEVLSSGEGL